MPLYAPYAPYAPRAARPRGIASNLVAASQLPNLTILHRGATQFNTIDWLLVLASATLA
ncbi:MAG: hypothetical protein ACRED2_13130 [Methylocella sp.]